MPYARPIPALLTVALAWPWSAPAAPLEPIVITASRTPEVADASLASVSVIGRDRIEQAQSRSVPDLLRGLPGVALRSNGGPGHNTNLYLRGTNPDHVLLLIDGLKLGSASSGFLPWQALPLEQVDRVEVVRGPRSSLYGSEAIGGVVQLFTRRDARGPLTARFSTTVGSHGLAEAQLGVSGSVPGSADAGWLDGAIGFQRTQGFDVCDGPAGCGVVEPDRDGYRSDSVRLGAGWALSERLAVDASYLRADSGLEYDGSERFGNRKDGLIAVAGAGIEARPHDAWTLVLRGGRSRDDATIYADGVEINRLDTRRDQLSWLNEIALAPRQGLTLGLDALRDRLEASADYAETERDNLGAFAQYRGAIADHALQLSLRHDDNEQFGGETTGNAAWAYAFANGLRATASFGTAFRAPSFNDLYFPGFGDPTLDPESSRSLEFGLAGDHAWGTWTLNLFQTDIDDLIAFDPASFSPSNIDAARIRGLELGARGQIAGWALAGQVTLLDPRNRSDGPDQDKLLQRRPEQTLRVDVDRRLGPVAVGGTLFASGRRFDDDANEVRLDGFALVDLRAEYAFSDALRVQGRVENLFDEDYQTASGFNQPGRSLFLTLRYEP
jgi:vitamin B12 transporter